jgi:inositol-phosphate phosphatase/L-galactose 1-phosphate phosphatase/histidinol-phosphatase
VRCKTRECASLAKATLSTTSPYLFGDAKPAFEALREKVRYTVFGHDCYAYAKLASGFIDVVVETGLKPHDFCALRPVIENAGGIMTDWQGKPLTLASAGDVIAAGDKRAHEVTLNLLKS